MHSAVACKRYFVYLHANGTSRNFADMEADFITGIWDYFPDGIEPYSYYVSWTSGTPKHYPESWWWLNHGEQVMALTYEDMNCESAGDYDKTAFAILSGIADYLDLNSTSTEHSGLGPLPARAYPNPIGDLLTVKWEKGLELLSIQIVDLMGCTVYQEANTSDLNGEIEIPTSQWHQNGSGSIYLLNLRFIDRVETIKLLRQ